MTRLLRRVHKWLGLVIGLQWLLWAVSGLGMSLLDTDQVRGRASRAAAESPRPWPADTAPMARVLAAAAPDGSVRSVSTAWLLDRPVYRVVGAGEAALVDARTGLAVEIDASTARALAIASYAGPGEAAAAERVGRSLETRAHPGPVWRIGFSDPEATTVYVSLQGDVLEHRNRTWRLFDIFWMLHIMDYRERQDFNHPLLVAMAVGALGLALSGCVLLCTRSGRAGMRSGTGKRRKYCIN